MALSPPEFTFYLGVHEPHWLAKAGVPLFVSHRRLSRRDPKKLPRASAPWALDSGGFTELSMFGAWQTTAEKYIAWTRRYVDEVGQLQWAAPQDWMCEPFMLDKTHKTIDEHQDLTVQSVLELRSKASELPFIPVLQGWQLDDYLRCVDKYDAAGIDLSKERIVGIGSVCRRQATSEIGDITGAISDLGIALHGFGVKALGLANYASNLASADSMAWSYNARFKPPLPGHTHVTCSNCLEWALRWRERLLLQLAAEPAIEELRLF